MMYIQLEEARTNETGKLPVSLSYVADLPRGFAYLEKEMKRHWGSFTTYQGKKTRAELDSSTV